MGSGKIRRALGAVKDQTSIGLAKVGTTSNSLSDLEVAIVKATRHEEQPAEEKHIQEIISLTSYSRAYVSACVKTLSKRLNKTRNWTVALKTLMLIQRLLADGDPSYEQEIFFATRRGTRMLNMSDFRDASRSNSWDYSAFVRTYALYLDERLEFRMQTRRGKRSAFGIIDHDRQDTIEEGHHQYYHHHHHREAAGAPIRSTPVREMRTDHIFSRIQHLQQLLERFLACRPTGGAKHDRVVIVALYPIVKESFQLYYDITEILGILIDRFMELEIPDSVKVHEIFCRVSKQLEELDCFYGWCKNVGIARSSEYPEVEKITQKKLDLMDDFIRDKSALAQTKKPLGPNNNNEQQEETNDNEQEEEDMYAMKALPPPEAATPSPVEEEEEKEKEPAGPVQQEADLLNLGDGAISTEDHAHQFALALFDNAPTSAATPAWEAFNDDSNASDWETALVQSASNLSNQKTTLGGGFDMMLLDDMYRQAANNSISINNAGNGSASSVALGSAGRPAMLALPAPPPPNASSTSTTTNADPFLASLNIAPPPYVQMSDMEKKQKLLIEEQIMWQQYARDGMQGHLGLSRLHHQQQQQPHSFYNTGGYARTGN